MLDLKRFQPSDALEMVDSAVEKDITDVQRHAAFNAAAGPAYTGYYAGKKVAAAGIIRHRNGCGTVWLMMSEKGVKYRKSAYHSMVVMMRILCRDFNFTYLRAQSKIGFSASQRLLEHLGFKKMRRMHHQYFYYRKEVGL